MEQPSLTRVNTMEAKWLMKSLVEQQSAIAAQVVPWYVSSFPPSYFSDVGEATRMEHLKGITALKAIDTSGDQKISLTVTSKADCGYYTEVTAMRTESCPGTLHTMLGAVQPRQDCVLHRVKAFMSNDESLTLNIFTYGPSGKEPPLATRADAERIMHEVIDKRQRVTSV
mmetsp:Transcript_4885/g.6281  ORF Transcript_4885/g.6281 Transcript_4885/m.6281 type:complete len:170 (-) Transcript_4885:3-512(-)